jgi:uncharacterized protein YbjQ (UPF0145 family)
MGQSGVPSDAELEAIAAGALPDAARRRLEQLAGIDGMSSSFLGPAEDALAPELGVVVLGQVVGASAAGLARGVLRAIGPGAADRHRPGEARWLERSGNVDTWTRARRRALWRIQEQAAIIGADAVVGVRVTRRQREAVAEVVLTGTGVRIAPRAVTPAPAAAPVVADRSQARALVTTLSLAQLAKLRVAGSDPVGLVGGCASVAAIPSTETARAVRRRRRRRRSAELDEVTFAFGESRRRAVERLRGEAARLGAAGVIGIELDDLEISRGGGGEIHVVLHLLGTAISSGRAVTRAEIDATLRTGAAAR